MSSQPDFTIRRGEVIKTTITLSWVVFLLFFFLRGGGGSVRSSIVLIKMFLQWFFANKKINITSTALKLCDMTEDVIFHVTFNVDTLSAIIITHLYQICLLKRSLVGRFKHLPDSRGTHITVYLCMQLVSKSSSLISCIIHVSSQPISLSFRMLKMCKIQRENILKRPIVDLNWLKSENFTDDMFMCVCIYNLYVFTKEM